MAQAMIGDKVKKEKEKEEQVDLEVDTLALLFSTLSIFSLSVFFDEQITSHDFPPNRIGDEDPLGSPRSNLKVNLFLSFSNSF